MQRTGIIRVVGGRSGSLLFALVLGLVTVVMLLTGPGDRAVSPVVLTQSTQPIPEVKPAQIVILVDESGSISQPDLDMEKEAAGLIAQAEFSPRSSVAVVGFGSDDVGGVGPVDVVCPPVVVAEAAERQQLSNCVNGLRKRKKDQGDGTDFAAALEQALSYLTGPPSGQKIVFLLTDGWLDVGSTTRYGAGKTVEQRTKAAEEVLGSVLRRAAAEQVQVWPLGFRVKNEYKPALSSYAIQAFQGACGRKPAATFVDNPADVHQKIFEMFSDARCAGIPQFITRPVGSGSSAEVPVDIPSIATDGSITVVKHDPRISIEFINPDGQPAPKSGSQGGSTFQASGQNSAVEALRIVDPQPGRWTVRISSPSDVPLREISTSVTWQGAVQARLTPSPSSPSAGQLLSVSLALHTRRGPVTDAAQLAGLFFTAELTRPGHAAIPIRLADDGTAPDPAGGDGTYTGQITVPPDATGSVAIVGRVGGRGISGDESRANVSIAPGPPELLVAATLPTITDTVAPGASTTGDVTVTNNSGRPRSVRVLVDQDIDSKITVRESDAVQKIAASGNTGFSVTLQFVPDTPEGYTAGTLHIVDDADINQKYGSFPFTVLVEKSPPYLLYVVIAAFVIGVVVVLLCVLRRRHEKRLDGLVVSVSNKNGNISDIASLTIPDDCRVYRFAIAHEENSAIPPQIQENNNGEYRLTRTRDKLFLATAGEKHTMEFGKSVVLSNGLTVVVKHPIFRIDHSTEFVQDIEKRIPVPRSTANDDPDL